MVATSLAWVRLTLAACAIRHSLVSTGSFSRHATTFTVRDSVSGYHRLMIITSSMLVMLFSISLRNPTWSSSLRL